MRAIAIPRQTLDWLVAGTSYIGALADDLLAFDARGSSFAQIGPIRIRTEEGLALLWHRDFAAPSLEVDWLVARLDGPMGLLADREITHLVFSRILRIAYLRFRNLSMPGSFIPRSFDGNRNTALAGRGGGAWQSSVGWIDERVRSASNELRVLGFVGPWSDPSDVATAQAVAILTRLEQDRNEFIRLALRARELRELPVSRVTDGTYNGEDWQQIRRLARVEEEEVGATPTEPAYAAELSLPPAQAVKLTYLEWVRPDSPLTPAQRRVLGLESIGKQPVRIHGPAGSGKSLLMQLLAIDWARRGVEHGDLSVIYLAHNVSARDQVNQRLRELADDPELRSAVDIHVEVVTINDLAGRFLDRLSLANLLDVDNQTSKEFQLEIVKDKLREELEARTSRIAEDANAFPTLATATTSHALMAQLARSTVAEIGYVIKAQLRGMSVDDYVLAPTPYSRLHGALTEAEREVVWDVYEAYDRYVAQEQGFLDNDDVALSLLQVLSTPLWRNLRRSRGCDLLLVDEAQLYSPTEKLLFQYLCREEAPPHPIVLALDKGQDLEGVTEQGLGLLGVGPLQNVEVYEMQRCSPAIAAVAMDIIFQTTGIFDQDFREFPEKVKVDARKDDSPPSIMNSRSERIGRGTIRQARGFRKRNYRSVGIVALTPELAKDVAEAARGAPDVTVIEDRATVLPKQPHIAIGTPATVGGLEFDAVVIVGCEHGTTPPVVTGSRGFQTVVDQRSLRELYLAVTRAKSALTFILSEKGEPSRLLEPSIRSGHILISDPPA
jgi:hypothetical protein